MSQDQDADVELDDEEAGDEGGTAGGQGAGRRVAWSAWHGTVPNGKVTYSIVGHWPPGVERTEYRLGKSAGGPGGGVVGSYESVDLAKLAAERDAAADAAPQQRLF